MFGKLPGKNIWRKHHLRCDLKDEKELANIRKKKKKRTLCFRQRKKYVKTRESVAHMGS